MDDVPTFVFAISREQHREGFHIDVNVLAPACQQDLEVVDVQIPKLTRFRLFLPKLGMAALTSSVHCWKDEGRF
jgi:hypothetical protein